MTAKTTIGYLTAQENKLFEPIHFDEIKTYGEWFRYWYLNFRCHTIRDITKQRYWAVYNSITEAELGNMDINEIKRLDVQNYVNEFGATRSKQTVLDRMQYIRSSLQDALTEGLITVNPAANVKVVSKEQNLSPIEQKAIREEKKWLEIDEYQKLKYYMLFQMEDMLKKYDKPNRTYNSQTSYYVLIFLAMKTGARISELIGLTRDDIDFEADQISIDKTWDYKFKGGFVPTKNLASIRKIPIDKETIDIIKKFFKWLDGSKKEMEQNTLFILKGQNFYASTANNQLAQLLEKIDIPKISMHKLRHTHASYLIAKGIPLQVVAKRLGHTDTNMISRVYGHLLEETENNGNRRILELL